MPGPSRPRQRVLVRWNDDLDKSLLLYITHTCTEMGIKIPYDEVARRMGSAFTEGAIVQHISKLRNKLAEIGTTPVPAAPKKGMITTRPSTVYAQKSRSGPLPLPASKTPAQANSRSKAAIFDSIEDHEDAPSAPAKSGKVKKTLTRKIKRSSSDEEASEVILENDAVDAGYGAKKRRRSSTTAKDTVSLKKARTARRTKVQRPSETSEFFDIQAAINNADAEYDREMAKNRRTRREQDDHTVSIQQSIENSDGPSAHTRGVRHNYAVLQNLPSDDDEQEEEEEETERPSLFPTQHNRRGVATDIDAFNEEQLSPRSLNTDQHDTLKLPTGNSVQGSGRVSQSGVVENATSAPVHGFFSNNYPHQTFAQSPQNTASEFHGAFGFSNFNNFDIGQQDGLMNATSMGAPVYPAVAFQTHCGPPQSSPSSRNLSTISSSSSFTTEPMPAFQMTDFENNFEGSNHHVAPNDTILRVGNMSFNSSAWAGSEDINGSWNNMDLGYDQYLNYNGYEEENNQNNVEDGQFHFG